MKKLILVFLFAMGLCQCNINRPDIVFEGEILVQTTEHLTAEILNDTFMFSWPRDIFIVDSLLIIHDSYKQANCFHVFRKKDGAHIKSFGTKGRGPEEFIEVNSVNCNYDDQSITVFDPNTKKVILFYIANILQGTEPRFKKFNISTAPNFVKQVILGKDKFITKGNSDKMRYGMWDPVDNHFSNLYMDYPRLTTDDETNWALTDYSVKVRLSPNGEKLVTGTYIGGVIEVFDVTAEGFKPSAIRFFFEPRYTYAQGAIPKWVTTTPETIIGFEDLFLTDESFYALSWGVEKTLMTQSHPSIIQFDYEGSPCRRYTFDATLESFAVDCDNTIYGVAYDKQGRYSLDKYTFSNEAHGAICRHCTRLKLE